ncbi:hypothetical protein [Bacillus wiedmannii]|uniref:hypothetical protein n=1 Tax=Bacillus wiedmannii TaxID=1890302 RepID=UPI000BFD5228|nr:hypothetical protein [Bacillus wiedmannii]PHG79767.1 hypothetical protein COI50_05330 [Bacillus wiedmannii]
MKFFVLVVIIFGFYSLSTTQVVQENILNPFIQMDIKLQIAFIGLFGVILAQIISHYFSKSREYEKKYIDIFEKLYAPYMLDIFEHVETIGKEYTIKENRLKVLVSSDLFHDAEKDLDSIIKNIRENTAYMTPRLLNIYFQVNRELKKIEKKYNYNNELLNMLNGDDYEKKTKLESENIRIKRKKMRLQYELLIVYLKQFKVTTRKAGLLSVSLWFRLKRFLKILEVYNIKVNCFLDGDLSLFEKVRYSLRLFFISPTALMRKEFYKEEKKDSNENIES